MTSLLVGLFGLAALWLASKAGATQTTVKQGGCLPQQIGTKPQCPSDTAHNITSKPEQQMIAAKGGLIFNPDQKTYHVQPDVAMGDVAPLPLWNPTSAPPVDVIGTPGGTA